LPAGSPPLFGKLTGTQTTFVDVRQKPLYLRTSYPQPEIF